MRPQILSLKSPNFSKFYPNPLKRCTCRETQPMHKNVFGISIKVTRQLKLIKQMTAFLCIAQKTLKKLFSQDLKLETKNASTFFLDFILFFNIAVEKLGKKSNLVKLELSKEIFLSPEYPDFGSKYQKFGKLISNYFYVV